MTLLAAQCAAESLLRAALLAKLAVDLEDPVLARRAAGVARSQAQLLCGLDFPTWDEDRSDMEELPELADVLALAYPRAVVEGGDAA